MEEAEGRLLIVSSIRFSLKLEQEMNNPRKKLISSIGNPFSKN